MSSKDDYDFGKSAFGNANISVNQLNHAATQGYIAERNRQESERQYREALENSKRTK